MFGGASLQRALRKAAPGLTRRYFNCQCQHISRGALSREAQRSSTPTWISAQLNTKRVFKQDANKARPSQLRLTRSFTTSLRRCNSTTLPFPPEQAKQARFPRSSSNIVAYWLLGSAASVFGIVVFGGLTRLTESGYVHDLFLFTSSNLHRAASPSPNGSQSRAVYPQCLKLTGPPNSSNINRLPNSIYSILA